MQQNDVSGHNSNQQRQQNSVIMEEVSQEEKELEGEYVGGSEIYHESSKSSRDGIAPLK
jgi:hypothetical protein